MTWILGLKEAKQNQQSNVGESEEAIHQLLEATNEEEVLRAEPYLHDLKDVERGLSDLIEYDIKDALLEEFDIDVAELVMEGLNVHKDADLV